MKYDYSKFEKLGIKETDFKFEVKRASSGIGSVGAINTYNYNTRRVDVILEGLGLVVGYFDNPSQLKNKYEALDMMYLLLKGLAE